MPLSVDSSSEEDSPLLCLPKWVIGRCWLFFNKKCGIWQLGVAEGESIREFRGDQAIPRHSCGMLAVVETDDFDIACVPFGTKRGWQNGRCFW